MTIGAPRRDWRYEGNENFEIFLFISLFPLLAALRWRRPQVEKENLTRLERRKRRRRRRRKKKK